MKKYLAYFIIESSSKGKAYQLLDERWEDIDPNLEVVVRELGTYGFSPKNEEEFRSDVGFRG